MLQSGSSVVTTDNEETRMNMDRDMKVEIDCLDLSVLGHIMNYLPDESKLNSRLVCKGWNQHLISLNQTDLSSPFAWFLNYPPSRPQAIWMLIHGSPATYIMARNLFTAQTKKILYNGARNRCRVQVALSRDTFWIHERSVELGANMLIEAINTKDLAFVRSFLFDHFASGNFHSETNSLYRGDLAYIYPDSLPGFDIAVRNRDKAMVDILLRCPYVCGALAYDNSMIIDNSEIFDNYQIDAMNLVTRLINFPILTTGKYALPSDELRKDPISIAKAYIDTVAADPTVYKEKYIARLINKLRRLDLADLYPDIWNYIQKCIPTCSENVFNDFNARVKITKHNRLIATLFNGCAEEICSKDEISASTWFKSPSNNVIKLVLSYAKAGDIAALTEMLQNYARIKNNGYFFELTELLFLIVHAVIYYEYAPTIRKLLELFKDPRVFLHRCPDSFEKKIYNYVISHLQRELNGSFKSTMKTFDYNA